jgi:hypothetical protein
MRKTLILIILIAFNICSAQTDIYTEIYRNADSLTIKNKVGILENQVYKIADSLSENHPMEYFKASAELLKERKFNEASFLYYLGYFRYRYFNSSNPNYQAGGDGALAGAFSSMLGEPVKMYLHCNVENFISILNLTVEYMKSNDYTFYSKEKDLEKYNLQLKNASTAVEDLKLNKNKYKKEWKKERKKFEKLLKDNIE